MKMAPTVKWAGGNELADPPVPGARTARLGLRVAPQDSYDPVYPGHCRYQMLRPAMTRPHGIFIDRVSFQCRHMGDLEACPDQFWIHLGQILPQAWRRFGCALGLFCARVSVFRVANP